MIAMNNVYTIECSEKEVRVIGERRYFIKNKNLYIILTVAVTILTIAMFLFHAYKNVIAGTMFMLVEVVVLIVYTYMTCFKTSSKGKEFLKQVKQKKELSAK